MSFIDAWFGTPTEKKREKYKNLYHDLNQYLKDFNIKLKKIDDKVSEYSANHQHMNESCIPEDIFGMSERNVKF